MNAPKPIIKCFIDGIVDFPYPSIPDESFDDIERAAAAIRILLSAYGGHMVSETPQFCSGGLLLTVVANDLAAPPFNSVRFDLYVRNVAEFIDATIESRTPLLTHDEHGVDTHDIEDDCQIGRTSGRDVSVRVDPGGRRCIKKKK